jgi:hypothetical protein
VIVKKQIKDNIIMAGNAHLRFVLAAITLDACGGHNNEFIFLVGLVLQS